MRLDTILERIAAFGLPYEHHEFRDNGENSIPAPPVIVWYATETTRGPDCGPVLLSSIEMAVELYTDEPDGELEKHLEAAILTDVEYKKFQTVIEKENMTQTAYEFTFLQKRSATA